MVNVFFSAVEKEAKKTHHELPVEENVNRLVPEGDEARTVEEAIAVLAYVSCLSSINLTSNRAYKRYGRMIRYCVSLSLYLCSKCLEVHWPANYKH